MAGQGAEASVEGRPDFCFCFGHSGEDNVRHGCAGQPGTLYLPTGHHIHSCAETTEQAADMQIGTGLEGVVGIGTKRGKGTPGSLIRSTDGGGGVDVGRCAHLRCNQGHGQIVYPELAATVGEAVEAQA